jgi:hypothetical protein
MSEKIVVNRKQLEEVLFNKPALAAVLAKTQHKPRNPGHMTNLSQYAREHSENASAMDDVHTEFRKLFFDLDVAVEIMIGLILSPKGGVKPELIYGCSYKGIPPNVIGSIISTLPEYIDERYRLSKELPRMLRKVMYTDGAVAKIIIPENVLDKVINGDMEYATEAYDVASRLMPDNASIPLKGILSNANMQGIFSVEGYGKVSHGMSPTLEAFKLTITDNFDLLSIPRYRSHLRNLQTESILSPYITGVDTDWKRQFGAFDQLDLTEVETTRKSIGTPLYLEVESATITPIHMPGDASKHVAYLALLDESGFIVNPADLRKEINEMQESLPSNPMGKSIVNTQIKNSRTSLDSNKLKPEQLITIFTTYINSRISQLVTSNEKGFDLEFGDVNTMYSAILARAMANRRTKLLFLPASMVAYYAFRFDENGIGKTLLDDLPTLSSMRAALLFSGLVSEIKNNIPQTKVNITLDESDMDPDASIAMIQSNTLERQANMSPFGLISLYDWSDWAHRSGFSFQVEQHPLLPNTKVQYEDVTPQRLVASESALHDKLRAQQIMAIGPTPEMVDNGFGSDYASTDQAKRVQLARRVTAYQGEVSDLSTSELRKIAVADGNIIANILEQLETVKDLNTYLTPEQKKAMKANRKLALTKLAVDISRHLTISLPNPDTDNVQNMLAAIQGYSDLLDLALESWITPDIIGGSEEEQPLSENVTMIKSALKAHFMREFMVKNGYLTFLANITSFSNDGKPKLDLNSVMTSHIKGLINTTKEYLDVFVPPKGGNDQAMDGPGPDDGTEDDAFDPTEGEQDADPQSAEEDDQGDTPSEDKDNPDEEDKVEQDGTENTDNPTATPSDLKRKDGGIKLSNI